MSVLLTPGVFRRVRREALPMQRFLRTDIAGFAGVAERGPLPDDGSKQDPVVRITSWAEFTAIFGGCTAKGYLAHAVRAFFENGGRICHVVRVASPCDNSEQSPKFARLPLPSRVRQTGVKIEMLGTRTEHGKEFVKFGTGQAVLHDGDLICIAAYDPEEMPAQKPIHGQVPPGDAKYRAFSVVRGVGHETAQSTFEIEMKAGWEYVNKNPLEKDPLKKNQFRMDIYDADVVLRARSTGEWGNHLWLHFKNAFAGLPLDFALKIFLEGPPPQKRPLAEENYHHVSLANLDDKQNPWDIQRHLSRSNLLTVEITDMRPPVIDWGILKSWADYSGGWFQLEGGRDGGRVPSTEDFIGSDENPRGLHLLANVDEVSILAVPDAVFPVYFPVTEKPSAKTQNTCAPQSPPPIKLEPKIDRDATTNRAATIQHAMLNQCERLRDRFAILDVPVLEQDQPVPVEDVLKWREQFVTRFGALYHPWLRVPARPDEPNLLIEVPPSGHMAGIYAKNDLERGVHHPPGNLPMSFVVSTTQEITDEEQDHLNPKHVNAIRSFAGRGIRPWGVRSLSPQDDGPWRFIHVRRLVSMIVESIEENMQWAAFEPNNDRLRRTIRQSTGVFLNQIWHAGGLKGARPEEGFYVRCDETNNPPAVVDAGQVICTIGLAITEPMEFIQVEIRQTANQAEQLAL